MVCCTAHTHYHIIVPPFARVECSFLIETAFRCGLAVSAVYYFDCQTFLTMGLDLSSSVILRNIFASILAVVV